MFNQFFKITSWAARKHLRLHFVWECNIKWKNSLKCTPIIKIIHNIVFKVAYLFCKFTKKRFDWSSKHLLLQAKRLKKFFSEANIQDIIKLKSILARVFLPQWLCFQLQLQTRKKNVYVCSHSNHVPGIKDRNHRQHNRQT